MKDLLTTTLHLSNIDMVVRTTNNGLFSLKDPTMPNIRSRDAKLQEAEGSLVKSSYVTMKLAEELAQAHSRGDLSPQIYDVLSDRCLHSLTLNSVAVQQLDQVRRSAFKPVLPAHLKGLAKVPPPPPPPPSPHVELFGDDLPTRQKELKEKADLAASLGKPPEKPSASYRNRRPYQRSTPYSRPPTATQRSSKTNWSQRRQNQDAQPPVKGQQKVCIPHVTLTFHPLRSIAACFRMWTLLTRDPNVLHIISQGVCLDFTSNLPRDRTAVYQPCLSAAQTAIVNAEIESLLRLQVIAPSPLAACLWISPIFTTLNKDGTSRLILNLKRLNLLITHIPFKMEYIRDVVHMVKQGVWMASVDLHHAYYSVSIHAPQRPYLSFFWQGTYYHYLRLPNGYAQAPLLFTKLLWLPFGSLRSQGHLSVVYMDDSYIQGDSVSSCRRNVSATLSLLQALGFNINERKSVLTPTQSLEFLGFIISSTTMTLTLTPCRKSNIAEVCTKLLLHTRQKIRFVSSVIGMLIAALPAVRHGALHYRAMEAAKNFALRENGGDFEALMTLSPEAGREVRW